MRFERDGEGGLVLVGDEGPRVAVTARRAFPWSSPEGCVSLRDEAGREVGFIEELSELSEAARALVEEALEASSFVPVIARVLSVDPQARRWRVETDRGPAQIEMQDRQDVTPLADGRFLVHDVYGDVHVLPPLDTLDARSRRLALEMV